MAAKDSDSLVEPSSSPEMPEWFLKKRQMREKKAANAALASDAVRSESETASASPPGSDGLDDSEVHNNPGSSNSRNLGLNSESAPGSPSTETTASVVPKSPVYPWMSVSILISPSGSTESLPVASTGVIPESLPGTSNSPGSLGSSESGDDSSIDTHSADEDSAVELAPADSVIASNGDPRIQVSHDKTKLASNSKPQNGTVLGAKGSVLATRGTHPVEMRESSPFEIDLNRSLRGTKNEPPPLLVFSSPDTALPSNVAELPTTRRHASKDKAAQNERIQKLATKSPLPLVKPEEDERSFWQRCKDNWLGKRALGAYFISIVAHLVVGITLSFMVIYEHITENSVLTMLSNNISNTSDSLDDSDTFTVEIPAGGLDDNLNAALAPQQISTALGPTQLIGPTGIDTLQVGDGNGQGKDEGEGIAIGGFRMPEGGRVVRKGSFTAWTEPQDPQPGQDYKIIIQIAYKKATQKLKPGDVTGLVVGTDGYRLMISERTAQYIPDARQVVVQIPGASALVRDSIRVYSTQLKETQRLEIVF